MIAQVAISLLLIALTVYAANERRRSPTVASAAIAAAAAGLYFTWAPEHATTVAQWAGVGRGVDLVLYIWVCINLIVLLNLHLKLRTQMEIISVLARKLALAEARAGSQESPFGRT